MPIKFNAMPDRTKQLADMLRMQSMQPIQNQGTGRLASAISPIQGLAQLLQGYNAGALERQAGQQQNTINDLQKTDTNALVNYLRSGQRSNPTQVQGMGGEALGQIPANKVPEMNTMEGGNMLAQMLMKKAEDERLLTPEQLAQKTQLANNQTPFYNFLPTSEGYAAGNARTGGVDMVYGPDGKPLVRATDDPGLQGNIKGAEVTAQQNAELAALPERGDIEAENAAKEKRAVLQAEYEAKLAKTQNGIGDIIKEARGVLTGANKPTASGVGTLVDKAGALVGIATEGSPEADQLRAIGGALVSKMPRMEGPQSDFDVQNYREMAGQVGDSTIPIERRLAALAQVEKLWAKYADQNKNMPEPTDLTGVSDDELFQ